MSFCVSIMPAMNASCTSNRDPRGLPCRRGVCSPLSHSRRRQRIAVEIPTPNRAAIERSDAPPAPASRARSRRSSLNARAITLFIRKSGETHRAFTVTSQFSVQGNRSRPPKSGHSASPAQYDIKWGHGGVNYPGVYGYGSPKPLMAGLWL